MTRRAGLRSPIGKTRGLSDRQGIANINPNCGREAARIFAKEGSRSRVPSKNPPTGGRGQTLIQRHPPSSISLFPIAGHVPRQTVGNVFAGRTLDGGIISSISDATELKHRRSRTRECYSGRSVRARKRVMRVGE